MSETEKKPKETVIKLSEHQFQHLLVVLSEINQGIKGFTNKLESLQTGLTKIEAELKLIRVEVNELKEKVRNRSLS